MTVRRMRRTPREWCEGQRARRRVLLLGFFLRISLCIWGLFCENLRGQLPREFFDGRDDAGRGAIHRVTDHRVTAIANGMDNFPTRESGELFHFAIAVT